ncbi:pyridoxamine 5'-phosphate oxidase family protein [Nocardioides sp. LHG3406-4]|uniref:pyridoxamine 5'-phosphate oxidase family protein n=1 Tax=Nocardioides sp. LHG3406-4 TaxID=2804575 RepID=UPI003CF2A33D
MLPGLDDQATAHAEQRLLYEQEIWITTVRPDGRPQASPVGFLWDGASFLILSQPESQKVRNLRGNPHVALHLEIDRQAERDGGVVTLEGVAELDPEPIGERDRRVHGEVRAVAALGGADAR